MLVRTLVGLAVVSALISSPASAEVRLTIAEGRVTLIAKNATIGEVLAEWARVGGTQIVNADAIASRPATLELTDIPEQQALDAVLSGVAGYVASQRAADEPALSRFYRVFVLPSSIAPPPAPPAVLTGWQPSAPAAPEERQLTIVQTAEPPPDDDRRGPTGPAASISIPASSMPGSASPQLLDAVEKARLEGRTGVEAIELPDGRTVVFGNLTPEIAAQMRATAAQMRESGGARPAPPVATSPVPGSPIAGTPTPVAPAAGGASVPPTVPPASMPVNIVSPSQVSRPPARSAEGQAPSPSQ